MSALLGELAIYTNDQTVLGRSRLLAAEIGTITRSSAS